MGERGSPVHDGGGINSRIATRHGAGVRFLECGPCSLVDPLLLELFMTDLLPYRRFLALGVHGLDEEMERSSRNWFAGAQSSGVGCGEIFRPVCSGVWPSALSGPSLLSYAVVGDVEVYNLVPCRDPEKLLKFSKVSSSGVRDKMFWTRSGMNSRMAHVRTSEPLSIYQAPWWIRSSSQAFRRTQSTTASVLQHACADWMNMRNCSWKWFVGSHSAGAG